MLAVVGVVIYHAEHRIHIHFIFEFYQYIFHRVPCQNWFPIAVNGSILCIDFWPAVNGSILCSDFWPGLH